VSDAEWDALIARLRALLHDTEAMIERCKAQLGDK
jgi:hypothetical protein